MLLTRAPNWILDLIPDLPAAGTDVPLTFAMLAIGTILCGFVIDWGASQMWGLVGLIAVRYGSVKSYPRADLQFLLAPLALVLAVARGLFGRASYRLHLDDVLSPEGHATFIRLPIRVRDGLDRPIGNFGDLAIHHVMHEYQNPANKRWARKLVSRVRDVSVLVSAFVIALSIVLGADLYGRYFHAADAVLGPEAAAAADKLVAAEDAVLLLRGELRDLDRSDIQREMGSWVSSEPTTDYNYRERGERLYTGIRRFFFDTEHPLQQSELVDDVARRGVFQAEN